MRYSRFKRLKITDRKRGKHRDILKKISSETTEKCRTGAILLVGGVGHDDLMVRQAQAHLRFDRCVSAWSHAAIILEWPEGASPKNVIGAEVALMPMNGEAQLPECNGVTLFTLDRYMDDKRYPNLGLCVLPMGSADKAGEPMKKCKKTIMDSATKPLALTDRFPLWEQIGAWKNFVHGNQRNPLKEQIPHPGASFCEAVYRSAGLDPSSSATDQHSCPEVLWSSLLYWYNSVDRRKETLRVYRHRQDNVGGPRLPEPCEDLKKDLQRLRRRKSTKRRKRA